MLLNNRDCKTEALDAVLEELSASLRRFDGKEAEDYGRRFEDIFMGGFAPEPSRVFFRLTEIHRDRTKSIDTLAENLRLLAADREAAGARCAGGLRQLADFVSLEAAHLNLLDASEAMKEQRAAAMIGKADAAVAAAQGVREKLGKLQRESAAAVGLVAVIAAAFLAGAGWSASVLANIEKATVYRLSGMTLLLGLGLFNLLALFMSFLRSLTGTEDTRFRTVYVWGNVIFLLLLAMAGAAWLFDLSEARPLLADWLRAALGCP